MNNMSIWIFLLIVLIFVLEYLDNNYLRKEKFSNLYKETNLITTEPQSTPNAININSKNNYFKNFGTIGNDPPYLKCPSCNIQYDCTNFPYSVDKEHKNVCTNCYEKIYMDPYYDVRVMSRSVGSPRKCRNILSE